MKIPHNKYPIIYISGESETGILVLQPGQNATVNLTIFNSGPEANFTLSIDSSSAVDVVEFFLDSPTITVGSNSSVSFLVRLTVSENATDGLAFTITVMARSTLDESNDFVTFELTVSDRPPPEFTDNVSKTSFSGHEVGIIDNAHLECSTNFCHRNVSRAMHEM